MGACGATEDEEVESVPQASVEERRFVLAADTVEPDRALDTDGRTVGGVSGRTVVRPAISADTDDGPLLPAVEFEVVDGPVAAPEAAGYSGTALEAALLGLST